MRWPLRLILVLLLALVSGRPAEAQDLGAVVVKASSDNVELPDPQGFGVSAHFDIGSWRLGLAYLRYSDDTEKSGVVCEVYSPRIGCRTEGVSTTARMGGLRATAQRLISLGEFVELGAGGGVSFNSLSVNSFGESGHRADLHLPNTGQIGYLGSASIALNPVPSLPLKLMAGISRHWVKFKGCVDPADPTSGYAPFCGWNRFTEVQAGISVGIPQQY